MTTANAQTPRPVAAPQSLLRARQACPDTATPTQCRAALRRAYEAIQWQKHERLHQPPYGVQHALRLASALYDVPLSEMRSQAMCESRLNPRAKNRHSTATGLLQFLSSTWSRAGLPGFPATDPYANALAAARLVKNDGGWREWSCQP